MAAALSHFHYLLFDFEKAHACLDAAHEIPALMG